MKHLVLFDIDGTILRYKKYNSREVFSSVIRDIFGKMPSFENLPDFSGMTDLQILYEIADYVGTPRSELDNRLPQVWELLLKEFKRHCREDKIVLLPGIRQLIERLSEKEDIQLALLTGNFRDNAYLKMKVFRLDKYFPFGAFGSDNSDRNQLPKIAVERGNEMAGEKIFDLSNSLIIGDSLRDIECAKSNNIAVLCVATGKIRYEDLEAENPDVLLKDFSDVDLAYNTIIDLLK